MIIRNEGQKVVMACQRYSLARRGLRRTLNTADLVQALDQVSTQ